MVHGMRMAMGEKWAIFGAQCDRNADCRGGVFAVFAKIPPPTLSTICAHPYYRIPPFPAVIVHMGMLAWVALVATWSAAMQLRDRTAFCVNDAARRVATSFEERENRV